MIGVSSGFQAWLLTFVLKKVYKVTAVELVYIIDIIDGRIKIAALRKALKESNEQDYNTIIDDV